MQNIVIVKKEKTVIRGGKQGPGGRDGTNGSGSSVVTQQADFNVTTDGAQSFLLSLTPFPRTAIFVLINGLFQRAQSGITLTGALVTIDASLEATTGDVITILYQT